jgi:hypothetical protein
MHRKNIATLLVYALLLVNLLSCDSDGETGGSYGGGGGSGSDNVEIKVTPVTFRKFSFSQADIEYGFGVSGDSPVSSCKTKGGNARIYMQQSSDFFDSWALERVASDEFSFEDPKEVSVDDVYIADVEDKDIALVSIGCDTQHKLTADKTYEYTIAGYTEVYGRESGANEIQFDGTDNWVTGLVDVMTDMNANVNLLNYGITPANYEESWSIMNQAVVTVTSENNSNKKGDAVEFNLDDGTIGIEKPTKNNTVNVAFTDKVLSTVSVNVSLISGRSVLTTTNKFSSENRGRKYLQTGCFTSSNVGYTLHQGSKVLALAQPLLSTLSADDRIVIELGSDLGTEWNGKIVQLVLEETSAKKCYNFEGASEYNSKTALVFGNAPTQGYVVLHEALHGLVGLGHQTDIASLMYPMNSGGHYLNRDEWNAIRNSLR